MKSYTKYISIFALFLTSNVNAAISLDGSVTGSITNDFESLSGGQVVGLLTQSGATYGERFSGQAVSTNSNGYDEITGTPSGSLSILSATSAQENLIIRALAGSNTIDGLASSTGQGALAILLDNDSDVFGFDISDSFYPSWGLSGDMYVEFFASDGSSLDSFVFSDVTDSFFGFRVDTGSSLIRGVSITHSDNGGLGFDNFTYSLSSVGSTGSGASSPVSVPSVISVVPEPSSYAMMLGGLGLVGFMAFRRKK